MKKNFWIILGVAAAAAALAGCRVGPNYQPPTTAAPARWASPLAGGETNLPPPDAAWWKAFRDAELDSLIARAARSNLNLRIASARVREARAARNFAGADLWPTANASANFAEERLSENGFPQFPSGFTLEDNVYQAGFDAAWELDVFGGKRRALEAAAAELAAAHAARDEVMISLLGEVARNYIETRGFQRRLAIARENLNSQLDVLAITKDRYRAGLTSELDVQEVSALKAATASQIPALATGFRQSAHRLAVLLGQPPGALIEELAPVSPIPEAPPTVPVGLPSDLLRRRPDVRHSERQLAAATARIGVAVADLFPQFSLTGDVGLQSISASDWFTGGSRFWSAGPVAQWRIFDAGRIRANIRLRNALQEEALAQYEQTLLSSFEDVENALTAYANEQTRRKSLADAVEASRQSLEIATHLYQNGLTDFIRVLDSQRSLYQAQDAFVQSERSVSLDLVVLYKALGGGWEAPENKTTRE